MSCSVIIESLGHLSSVLRSCCRLSGFLGEDEPRDIVERIEMVDRRLIRLQRDSELALEKGDDFEQRYRIEDSRRDERRAVGQRRRVLTRQELIENVRFDSS